MVATLQLLQLVCPFLHGGQNRQLVTTPILQFKKRNVLNSRAIIFEGKSMEKVCGQYIRFRNNYSARTKKTYTVNYFIIYIWKRCIRYQLATNYSYSFLALLLYHPLDHGASRLSIIFFLSCNFSRSFKEALKLIVLSFE